MSAQDEYGRHAYEAEGDEDGDLRTHEDSVGSVTYDGSGDPVQGDTLLPVDPDDESRDGEAYGGDGVVEGETVAEHSVTYDSATGEPVQEQYTEETVAGDAGYADEPVLTGDAVAGDEADDESDDESDDDAVADDVVTDEPAAVDSSFDSPVGDSVDDSVDDSVADEPAVVAPTDDSVADDSVADDSVADDSVADDSVVDTPASDEQSWQELKGLFVDDPAGAVAGAASKVDAAIAALREHGTSAGDTEQLRLAFRRYQEIHRSLTES